MVRPNICRRHLPLPSVMALSRLAGLRTGGHGAATFGTVHFPHLMQRHRAGGDFDRGMRYQHSFWYSQAREVFEDAAQGRRHMRPSPIGASRSRSSTIRTIRRPQANLPLRPGGPFKRPRRSALRPSVERDYINALAVDVHRLRTRVDHRSRVLAYLKAMEALAAKYIATTTRRRSPTRSRSTSGASPADKDPTPNQLKGRGDPGANSSGRQPTHPGGRPTT